MRSQILNRRALYILSTLVLNACSQKLQNSAPLQWTQSKISADSSRCQASSHGLNAKYSNGSDVSCFDSQVNYWNGANFYGRYAAAQGLRDWNYPQGNTRSAPSCSVEWNGFIEKRASTANNRADDHKLCFTVANSGEFWLDDVLQMKNDSAPGGLIKCTDAALSSGKHKLRLVARGYAGNQCGGGAMLMWAGDDSFVAADQLTPADSSGTTTTPTPVPSLALQLASPVSQINSGASTSLTLAITGDLAGAQIVFVPSQNISGTASPYTFTAPAVTADTTITIKAVAQNNSQSVKESNSISILVKAPVVVVPPVTAGGNGRCDIKTNGLLANYTKNGSPMGTCYDSQVNFWNGGNMWGDTSRVKAWDYPGGNSGTNCSVVWTGTLSPRKAGESVCFRVANSGYAKLNGAGFASNTTNAGPADGCVAVANPSNIELAVTIGHASDNECGGAALLYWALDGQPVAAANLSPAAATSTTIAGGSTGGTTNGGTTTGGGTTGGVSTSGGTTTGGTTTGGTTTGGTTTGGTTTGGTTTGSNDVSVSTDLPPLTHPVDGVTDGGVSGVGYVAQVPCAANPGMKCKVTRYPAYSKYATTLWESYLLYGTIPGRTLMPEVGDYQLNKQILSFSIKEYFDQNDNLDTIVMEFVPRGTNTDEPWRFWVSFNGRPNYGLPISQQTNDTIKLTKETFAGPAMVTSTRYFANGTTQQSSTGKDQDAIVFPNGIVARGGYVWDGVTPQTFANNWETDRHMNNGEQVPYANLYAPQYITRVVVKVQNKAANPFSSRSGASGRAGIDLSGYRMFIERGPQIAQGIAGSLQDLLEVIGDSKTGKSVAGGAIRVGDSNHPGAEVFDGQYGIIANRFDFRPVISNQAGLSRGAHLFEMPGFNTMEFFNIPGTYSYNTCSPGDSGLCWGDPFYHYENTGRSGDFYMAYPKAKGYVSWLLSNRTQPVSQSELDWAEAPDLSSEVKLVPFTGDPTSWGNLRVLPASWQ